MELSGAHIIDLMHAVAFASFKGREAITTRPGHD